MDEKIQQTPEEEITIQPQTVIEEPSSVEPTNEIIVDQTPVVTEHPNTPGVIVLQWLSYAFWGWLIVALIWLTSIVLANVIIGNSSDNLTSGSIPYAIAAAIVLLPIAFFTDFFYRKHEPAKKAGIAMVILVIHSVIFALLTIISLILTVFFGLNALIETDGTASTQMITILTTAISTLLYAAVFMRVLNPFKFKKSQLIFGIAMTIVTVTLLVLAISGPLLQALSTKDDRRIEQAMPTINQSINSYIQTNERLPASLSDVTLDDDNASTLVKNNTITFKPEESSKSLFNNKKIEYRYQLCTTYSAEDATNNKNYGRTLSGYSSYVDTAGHPKGDVCYKSSETVYLSDDSSDDFNVEGTVLN